MNPCKLLVGHSVRFLPGRVDPTLVSVRRSSLPRGRQVEVKSRPALAPSDAADSVSTATMVATEPTSTATFLMPELLRNWSRGVPIESRPGVRNHWKMVLTTDGMPVRDLQPC